MYLAVLGLSCCTQDLHCCMWDLVFPYQGWKPGPLHWDSSHWTIRKVPYPAFLMYLSPVYNSVTSCISDLGNTGS